MRISDLNVNEKIAHYVETPSDVKIVIQSLKDIELYVEEYGDVEIVNDGEFKNWVGHQINWSVPEFAESIKKFVENKTKWCDKYGCE